MFSPPGATPYPVFIPGSSPGNAYGGNLTPGVNSPFSIFVDPSVAAASKKAMVRPRPNISATDNSDHANAPSNVGAGKPWLVSQGGASPDYIIKPQKQPDKRLKDKLTDFGRGFGKGLLSVLSMPWQGALLTIGVAIAGLVMPWAVPMVMLVGFAIGAYQTVRAVQQNDWEKAGQGIFSMVAPLLGGRWLSKGFPVGGPKPAKFTLPPQEHPHIPKPHKHGNVIREWFRDAYESFRDSAKLLKGKRLENSIDPGETKTIYQVAKDNLTGKFRSGLSQDPIPGLKKAELDMSKDVQTSGIVSVSPSPQSASPASLLFLMLAPGGPANSLGMELTPSQEEEDRQEARKMGVLRA